MLGSYVTLIRFYEKNLEKNSKIQSVQYLCIEMTLPNVIILYKKIIRICKTHKKTASSKD